LIAWTRKTLDRAQAPTWICLFGLTGAVEASFAEWNSGCYGNARSILADLVDGQSSAIKLQIAFSHPDPLPFWLTSPFLAVS
jgi:hypothetical protein